MRSDDHFARKFEIFVGGPCHDQVLNVAIASSRTEIFRSGIRGDDTVYYYRGINSQRYYRFFGVWRWEGLDVFDTLFLAHRSSQEWTSPCHGEEHRFKSGMGRLNEDFQNDQCIAETYFSP